MASNLILRWMPYRNDFITTPNPSWLSGPWWFWKRQHLHVFVCRGNRDEVEQLIPCFAYLVGHFALCGQTFSFVYSQSPRFSVVSPLPSHPILSEIFRVNGKIFGRCFFRSSVSYTASGRNIVDQIQGLPFPFVSRCLRRSKAVFQYSESLRGRHTQPIRNGTSDAPLYDSPISRKLPFT